MESIIATFGLDWKLLLAQPVNFFVLLAVLRFTVYRPLLAVMKKRQKTIETGLEKAIEADERLASISEIQLQKTREAEKRGVEIIHEAELKAKTEEQNIIAKANEKEQEIDRKSVV